MFLNRTTKNNDDHLLKGGDFTAVWVALDVVM